MVDLLTADGWPIKTEAKDIRIREALNQANMDATASSRVSTDMTTLILKKLHHIGSLLQLRLKQVAKELVPKIYGLLPDDKWAKAVGPEVASNYMKEKVAYWREGLHCFHERFVIKDDKEIPLVWNNPLFHEYLFQAFYVHHLGPAKKAMDTFLKNFPVILMALGGLMVEVVLDEHKNGVFDKQDLDKSPTKDLGTYLKHVKHLKATAQHKFHRRYLKEYRESIAAWGSEHLDCPGITIAISGQFQNPTIKMDAIRSDVSDDEEYTDYESN